MDRDKEIWAMALWVEKRHGANGWFYIAQQQDRLLAEGEDEGARLWARVGERFKAITADSAKPVSLN